MTPRSFSSRKPDDITVDRAFCDLGAFTGCNRMASEARPRTPALTREEGNFGEVSRARLYPQVEGRGPDAIPFGSRPR